MKRRMTRPGVSFFAFQDIITAVVGIFVLIVILLALELAQRVEANSSGSGHDVAAIRAFITSLQADNERMQQEIQARSTDAIANVAVNPFNHSALLADLEQQRQQLQQQIASQQNRQKSLAERLGNAEATEVELLAAAAELEPERERLTALQAEQAETEAKLARVRTINTPVFRDVAENGREVTLVVLANQTIRLRDAQTQQKKDWAGPSRVVQFSTWIKSHSLQNRHFLLIVQPGGSEDFNQIQTKLQDARAVFGLQVAGSGEHYLLGFELQ